MSKLYWRIFLAFWAVLIVTTVITVAVNAIAFRDQEASTRFESVRALLDAVSAQAQRVLADEGEEGLRAWLRSRQRDPAIPPLLVVGPDGEELLGRPLPPRGLGPGQWRGLEVQERLMRRLTRELRDPEGRRYVLILAGRQPRFGGWFLRRQARFLYPLVLVLVSGVACLLLARYLVRPIQAFRAAGQRIAAGDLGARIEPRVARRPDEFGALAEDFDHMAERIQQLVESQQRLLRDVSHELRSPLARLQAAVDLIRQDSASDPMVNLDRIEKESGKLNDMIGQILAFARLNTQSSVNREPVAISDLVARVVEDARYEGQSRGRQVAFEPDPSAEVSVDEGLIHSAVENVVRNALQHSQAQSWVVVRAGDSDGARITVSDDGPGVAEADLQHLFEPFYTGPTSNSGQASGAGIGLAIAHRAVALHGGRITARNGETGGLVVEIELL